MGTRIYTRTGDKGTSCAIHGQRLPKSHLVFEVEGHLDSVNSSIGLIMTDQSLSADLYDMLMAIQRHIFDIGAHFWKKEGSDFISQEKVDSLEKHIDKLSEDLPKLKNFILPGGTPLAAHCHIARAQCRQCERIMVRYDEKYGMDILAIKYINRLSDFLFTLARYTNNKGQSDILWHQ